MENLEKYLVKLTEKIPDIGCRFCDGAEEEMPQKSLGEETKILIKQEKLDCTLFGRMGNLKELILHDCELENIGCLAGAPVSYTHLTLPTT